jgi:hypothetical protein
VFVCRERRLPIKDDASAVRRNTPRLFFAALRQARSARNVKCQYRARISPSIANARLVSGLFQPYRMPRRFPALPGPALPEKAGRLHLKEGFRAGQFAANGGCPHPRQMDGNLARRNFFAMSAGRFGHRKRHLGGIRSRLAPITAWPSRPGLSGRGTGK